MNNQNQNYLSQFNQTTDWNEFKYNPYQFFYDLENDYMTLRLLYPNVIPNDFDESHKRKVLTSNGASQIDQYGNIQYDNEFVEVNDLLDSDSISLDKIKRQEEEKYQNTVVTQTYVDDTYSYQLKKVDDSFITDGTISTSKLKAPVDALINKFSYVPMNTTQIQFIELDSSYIKDFTTAKINISQINTTDIGNYNSLMSINSEGNCQITRQVSPNWIYAADSEGMFIKMSQYGTGYASSIDTSDVRNLITDKFLVTGPDNTITGQDKIFQSDIQADVHFTGCMQMMMADASTDIFNLPVIIQALTDGYFMKWKVNTETQEINQQQYITNSDVQDHEMNLSKLISATIIQQYLKTDASGYVTGASTIPYSDLSGKPTYFHHGDGSDIQYITDDYIQTNTIDSVKLKDNTLAASKLVISNSETDGYYLQWTTANGMTWALPSSSFTFNTSLIPTVNNLYDVGSTTKNLRALYSVLAYIYGNLNCYSIIPQANATYNCGSSSYIFDNVYGNTINCTYIQAPSTWINFNDSITPATDNNKNSGSSGYRWNNTYSTTVFTTTTYADYINDNANNYVSVQGGGLYISGYHSSTAASCHYNDHSTATWVSWGGGSAQNFAIRATNRIQAYSIQTTSDIRVKEIQKQYDGGLNDSVMKCDLYYYKYRKNKNEPKAEIGIMAQQLPQYLQNKNLERICEYAEIQYDIRSKKYILKHVCDPFCLICEKDFYENFKEIIIETDNDPVVQYYVKNNNDSSIYETLPDNVHQKRLKILVEIININVNALNNILFDVVKKQGKRIDELERKIDRIYKAMFFN